jgi:Zn-dependent protease
MSNWLNSLDSKTRRHLSIASFVVTTAIFGVWFKDARLVIGLMVGLLIHEFGHVVASALFGIEKQTVLFFGPIGAVCYRLEGYLDNILARALTDLAGVFAQSMLIVMSIWLQTKGISGKYWIAGISINSLLIFGNLLPFRGYDGMKLIDGLFSRVSTREKQNLQKSIIALTFISSVTVYVKVKHLIAPASVLLGGFFVWLQIRRTYNYREDGLVHFSAKILIAIYILMLFGSITAVYFFPFWELGISIWPMEMLKELF